MPELPPGHPTPPASPALPPSPGGAPVALHPTPGSAGDGPFPSTDAIDLKESLAVLRRHLWLIAAVTAAVVAFAGYRISRQRLQYQATAVIRLVDARRQLAGNLDNSDIQRPMAGSWTDPIQSELQVLRSRGIAALVVDSQALGLRVQPQGFPAYVLSSVELSPDAPLDTVRLRFEETGVSVRFADSTLRVPYGLPVMARGIRFTVASRPPRGVEEGRLVVITRSAAVNLVLAGLRARQRDRTDVVDVSYTAYDPAVAQQVANTVVRVFQAENAEQAQQQSRRRRVFVEEQLRQTDSLLTLAQNRLGEYRAAKQVYGSDAVVSAEQAGLLDLDVKRQELVADRQVYRSLLSELSREEGDAKQRALRALVASPGIAENPVVQGIYQQLVAYQAAVDSLTTGRWARAGANPDVQRLQALVEKAERELADAVESQIISLDARLAALDELRARNAAALKALPATQAGEARLVEQLESTRALAEQLRAEYQKARIAEAVEAGQVEIVDLATPPYAPIGTSRRVRLLTALIVGLMLGVGAAFVVERLDTAIRRREEIESVLQVPGLAIIPQIASRRPARLRLGQLSVPLPLPPVRRLNARSNGATLVTVSDARSNTAEAFRALRTNLIFAQAVQTLRTIVVTSPSPQDGKTTTAANLAVTFAQQGMRVLIADCDLRRARLHHVFRIPREPGLTHVLLDEQQPGEVIRSTAVERLFVLPAGALPPNPSELLGGPRMRAVVEAFAQEYDIVILDSPPVHAAADAIILGAMSDGVLLVLRAGHTERLAAQDALHRITAVGVRVVGAVLNDPDHKVPQYGSYYYYDYQDDEPGGPHG